MTALSPKIASRVALLLPRLASDHGGEVQATAAAIDRVLKAGGVDLHDLAKHVATGPKTVVQYVERPAEPAPFASRAWQAAAGRYPVNVRADLARVDRIQDVGWACMTAWEADYVESIRSQLLGGRPLSLRQGAVLGRIEVKIRRRP